MHGRLLLPLAALLALALPAAPAAARTIALTDDDSGSTVTARVGDRIAIALDANETTGYRWTVTAKPDSSVAKLVVSRYVPDAAEPGMVGSGGTQRYAIRARARGRTAFTATYAQVGSGDVGRTFTIKIRVKAPA